MSFVLIKFCAFHDVPVSQKIHNKRKGQGKYNFYDGCTYEGTWKNDRMEGKGTFKQANGAELSGVFKNNYYYTHGHFVKPSLPVEQHKELFE